MNPVMAPPIKLPSTTLKIGDFSAVTKSNPDGSVDGGGGSFGGGWQTAVLSALDERVRVIVPVAGHSPAWCRLLHERNFGDLEQLPSDLCVAADYDVLTGLFAPRPTLLIYNRDDDCCFQSGHTRRSVYRPASVSPVSRTAYSIACGSRSQSATILARLSCSRNAFVPNQIPRLPSPSTPSPIFRMAPRCYTAVQAPS